MTSPTSYRICRVWNYPDRPANEPRYEIDKIYDLSADEYDRVASIYQKVLGSNHPAMAELLADVIADYKLGHALLTVGAYRGQPSKGRAERATKQARISAFAAANAVYSYQEHSKAIANRIGGSAPADVGQAFRSVYDDNWRYLFAYQLRKIFTHVSVQALTTVVRSTAPGLGEAKTSLETTIIRSAVQPSVGPKVRRALAEHGTDPVLGEVLDHALAGVNDVQSQIRTLIYPELPDDLAYLSKWQKYLLSDPPVCIALVPPNPTIETMAITAILPSELRTAGMIGR